MWKFQFLIRKNENETSRLTACICAFGLRRLLLQLGAGLLLASPVRRWRVHGCEESRHTHTGFDRRSSSQEPSAEIPTRPFCESCGQLCVTRSYATRIANQFHTERRPSSPALLEGSTR
jgi:hypothetical protein